MADTEAEVEELFKRKPKSPIKAADLVSSGSTLVNLACSGKTVGAYCKGCYYLYVGDSSSGKTFLVLTALAEASINENFDNYRLIYDNVENGALMDWEHFYGKKLAERIEPPRGTQEDPKYSATVEEFYDHLDDACNDKKPFIYVLDSMDALSSEDEKTKARKNKAVRRKGTKARDDEDDSEEGGKIKGSFGDGKAKKNSSGMRQTVAAIRESGSIVIVICQTRDNIGFGAQFNPKVRSGGKALKFYVGLEIWTSVKGHIKKNVNGKDRELGIIAKTHVKKNRLTGKDIAVDVRFLHALGVDDISSCVYYLISEGHWNGSEGKNGKAGKVTAPEFDFEDGSVDKLVAHIEKNDLEDELRILVKRVWNDIEEACTPIRKQRYT